MESGSEHEADTDLLEALLQPFSWQIYLNTELVQDIGTTRVAGRGPISVFSDGYTGTGCHEGSGRGYIERLL
jgi:hypothetical protein